MISNRSIELIFLYFFFYPKNFTQTERQELTSYMPGSAIFGEGVNISSFCFLRAAEFALRVALWLKKDGSLPNRFLEIWSREGVSSSSPSSWSSSVLVLEREAGVLMPDGAALVGRLCQANGLPAGVVIGLAVGCVAGLSCSVAASAEADAELGPAVS